jgi:hypothetical protein
VECLACFYSNPSVKGKCRAAGSTPTIPHAVIIEKFKAHREEQKIGVVTVNHSLRALRRSLHLAVEWEYITKAPKIKLRPEPKRDYVIGEAIFQRFLDKCGQPAQQITPTV